MNNGSVFQRKDLRWCAKYDDHTGKTRYLYRKTKSEAKKALKEATQKRAEGQVPASKISVDQFLDQWIEELEYKVSERTWLNRESLVRCHIKPGIGSKQLAKLTHTDIQRLYRRKLEEGLAHSTVERIHVLINQVLTIAVRRKYISDNPMAEVTPPKVYRQERKILSPDQVKHFLNTVRGHRFELAVVLGASMALRVNEALALRWDDVDFDNATITVQHTLWRGERCNPKTQSSMAVLEVPAVAMEALRRIKMDTNGQGYLFPTRSGKPVCSADFHKYWKKMLKQAELPDITYHCLRHGAASYLLQKKCPLPNVSKYLRHAGPEVTAKLYSHIVYGTERMVASEMDQALS